MKDKTNLFVKKRFLLALAMCLLVFHSCRKNESELFDDGLQTTVSRAVTTPKVILVPANNNERMLEDGEPVATFISEDRRINFARLLRVKAINNTTIEVANFTPVDITNATILIAISGRSRKIKLLICDIKANTIKRVSYPFISGTTQYAEWETNVTVDLSQYRTVGIAPANVSFDYTGTTPLLQKLKKAGEMKWNFKPSDIYAERPGTPSYKQNPTAQDFRKFSVVLINMAWLYSSATGMRDAYKNEPITNNSGVLMTTAQKEAAFNSIVNKTNIKLGIVRDAEGRASSDLLGLSPWVINNVMYAPGSTFPHEMSHVIGFTHSSTMTYPKDGKGAVPANNRIWQAQMANLPVVLSNYYKAGDFTAP